MSQETIIPESFQFGGTLTLMTLVSGLSYNMVERFQTGEGFGIDSSLAQEGKLAHVVDEVMDWKTNNYIALTVMFISGVTILGWALFYRRHRAERSGSMDSSYWFMVGLACVCTSMYIGYSLQYRRKKALEDALRLNFEHSDFYWYKVIAGTLLAMFLVLLYYRRYRHLVHLERKRRHHVHHAKHGSRVPNLFQHRVKEPEK